MTPQTDDSPRGLACAVSAYVLWGFMPLYLSTLAHVSPAEIITHRILWSIPVAAVVLIATGRTADLGRALRSPRTLGMAGVTALLVAANWGIYVWAVTTGRALDAALGFSRSIGRSESRSIPFLTSALRTATVDLVTS